MHAALHQYKLRLTNLNQANRSLKLGRLSSARDLDLMQAGHIDKLSTVEILERIASGKSVDLLSKLSARNEDANLLDRRLTRIFREVSTINEETGAYDLFLGYPFVEGKFLDGSVARCPVMLFPVRLVRNLQKGPRWRLEVPDGESISFNKTFFLAYEKFQQVRLPRTFWEEDIERQPDLQDLLNYLYAFFKEHELQVNFNSELFQFQVVPFADKNKDLLDKLELGKLKFQPTAVLGIFPQSDSALLQDYELLEKEAEGFGLDRFLEEGPALPAPKYIPEDQRYFVTPVDQSQEEALLAVKNGRSVVVHGPPGTGKSQVILNLVSDALARGQRVLVCSQKRAALDVVYRRLSDLGLGRFVALVHDHRADRARIFEKIRNQIDDIERFQRESADLRISQWEHDFRLDARKIDSYNGFFEKLQGALLDRERFGLSAHQLYERADARLRGLPLADLPLRFDQGALSRLLDRFRALLPYLEFFEEKYPLRFRKPFHLLGFEQRHHFADFLNRLPEECVELRAAKARTGLGAEVPGSPEDIQEALAAFDPVRVFFEDASLATGWAAFHCQDLKLGYVRRKLDSLEKIFDAMAGFEVLSDFNMTLFQDLKEHVEHYRAGAGKFGSLFSLGFLRARWYLKALLNDKGFKLKDDPLGVLYGEFRVLDRLVKHAESFSGQFFFEDLPLTDSPARLKLWLAGKRKQVEAVSIIRKVKVWRGLIPPVEAGKPAFNRAVWDRSLEQLDEVRAYLALLGKQLREWAAWLHPLQIEALRAAMDREEEAKLCRAWGSSLENDFEDLRSLDHLLADFQPDERLILTALEGDLAVLPSGEGPTFMQRLENTFSLRWIEALEARHPELLEVSARGMAAKREDYQDKVHSRQEKVIQLIVRQLKERILKRMEYNRLGNPVTYRDLGHQARKKRLLWSVRRMVREFWTESLSQLLPCWMASPESVAAVFPMERDFFDLVVFDEASQCYVERGLPVMLRGRQCVVAGDDKQLPPFDLYSVKVDEYEREVEEAGIALEVESTLDLARNVFQDCHLSWHYRSREEDLINFSNHAFYKGRLKTIPWAARRQEAALSFIRVDGVWEQNRNVVEARRVVALLEELVRQENPPTVGVVTFNFQQKELIRDELELRIQELGEMGDEVGVAAFFRAMAREDSEEMQGIFVKNIENVQGDERDVIVFSVAYARDAKGRLVTNFGLLNQKGGENRLNVAITRARKKVFLVCSFDPEALQVEQSLHAGPKLFKQYLLYARAVGSGNRPEVSRILAGLGDGGGEPEPDWDYAGPGLADRVASALEKRGWEVERNIGDTEYQLDLAVIDPGGGYLAGIEVEGPQYFSGKSPKEREVYRVKLLKSRGWVVARVWARNHFLREEEVVAELDALARAELERRKS